MSKLQIAALALLAAGACALFAWFVYALSRAEVGIQSAVLALIGVASSAIFAHLSAKKREIEARHFADKREGYKELVDLVFDLMTATKIGKKPPPQQHLMKKILEFKKMLLTWADADFIAAWEKIEQGFELDLAKDPVAALLVWDDLLRAMRKDLGKNDVLLPRGALVSVLLDAEGKDSVASKT